MGHGIRNAHTAAMQPGAAIVTTSARQKKGRSAMKSTKQGAPPEMAFATYGAVQCDWDHEIYYGRGGPGHPQLRGAQLPPVDRVRISASGHSPSTAQPTSWAMRVGEAHH